MKQKNRTTASTAGTLALALLCMGAAGFADDDVDLKINGDFIGASLGAASAPGWNIKGQGGSAVIVQGSDGDDLALELNASAFESKTFSSDFLPVSGNLLKIKGDARGTGSAFGGFTAFDGNKQPIPGADQAKRIIKTAKWTEFELFFALDNPAVKFIKLEFAASQPNAKAAFSDLDAEFVHADSAAGMPPKKAEKPDAKKHANAGTEDHGAKHDKEAKHSGGGHEQKQVKPLKDDKHYSLKAIEKNNFTAKIPVGKDIDFELEEDGDSQWSVESADENICRVKLEHDVDGIWPFRSYSAEIELKGRQKGTTDVVFTHPSGQKFTVQVTVP